MEKKLLFIIQLKNLGFKLSEIAGAPRACYVDGIWNQEDPQKWLTIIQVPVKKTDA